MDTLEIEAFGLIAYEHAMKKFGSYNFTIDDFKKKISSKNGSVEAEVKECRACIDTPDLELIGEGVYLIGKLEIYLKQVGEELLTVSPIDLVLDWENTVCESMTE